MGRLRFGMAWDGMECVRDEASVRGRGHGGSGGDGCGRVVGWLASGGAGYRLS